MSRKPDIDPAAITPLLRRVFGGSPPVTYERTPDGVSTQVYRLQRGPETFYLRIAETADENLETDAELHRRLRDLGVRVAEPVFVEPFDAAIDRSVMITTAVPGVSLADVTSQQTAESVVREAGVDLALINQVPVEGYGWVERRGGQWPFQGKYASYSGFVTSYLPPRWPGPLAPLFPARVLDAIETMVEHERGRSLGQGRLAHGDFDVTPIFCDRGRYTGVIDFGEIRGAEPHFDLGHFHLHDHETVPVPLLPALLDGYQQVQALPPDHEDSIHRSAVLLGLRQLCRWISPERGFPLDHPLVVSRANRITELVTRR